jgi:methionyl-tRNA formyltransferase
MKKILSICCSDVLGIPALLQLQQQGLLAGVAVADSVASQLVPVYKSAGIPADAIHILTKKGLEAELNLLIDKYEPDALFVFTFSWMIPCAILARLRQRCINFHFGLLPKYKGADPVFWQIKNGEPKCGLSVHIMTEELDAGPVILKEEVPAMPGENYGLNAQRLAALGAQAAIKVASLLDTVPLPIIPLPVQEASYLEKPAQTDLLINWQTQSAAEIENLVNAANPRYQGAITSIRQMQINLLEVSPADVNNPTGQQFVPGTIVHADQLYGLIVACINNQYLKINVAFMQQGYFSGSKLFSLGFAAGEVFGQ